MGLLRELFGPSKDEVWSALASSLGGRLTSGGWLGEQRVQAAAGDWIVTLDTTYENKTTYTRVRAPFVNRDGFRFYRAGFFTPLGKLFGIQDLELGYPFFDPEFVIQSNQPQKVGELLASERIRNLIKLQPEVYFTVLDDEGWFGPAYPGGVDQLLFKVHGVIRDLDRLRALYDLFAEVLNGLCHLDSAYREDLQLHLETLYGPGGRIRHQGVILWDGDRPKIRAARALTGVRDPHVVDAFLRLLPGSEGELALALLRGLGEAGDLRAVGPLLPYLGDCRRAPDAAFGSAPFREAAEDALRNLGQEAAVAAFGAVLRGQTDRLAMLDPAWRPAFVAALRAALHSENLTEVSSAARALAEWGAVESLPDLRALARRLRPVGGAPVEAVDQAIRRLETHVTLPRPSEAPAPVSAELPRPAGAPEPSPADLPIPGS